MCSTRRPGRNSGTMHQGGSRAPGGIRPDASTSRPSKARLSSPRRQAGRGTCRRTRVPAPLRPPALTALLPWCRRCCGATSHPRKSQQRSLRRHRRRLLAANASATLLEELKVLAWYFLSPDTFRSEVTDTRMVPVQQVELKDRTPFESVSIICSLTPLPVGSLSKIAHSLLGVIN